MNDLQKKAANMKSRKREMEAAFKTELEEKNPSSKKIKKALKKSYIKKLEVMKKKMDLAYEKRVAKGKAEVFNTYTKKL